MARFAICVLLALVPARVAAQTAGGPPILLTDAAFRFHWAGLASEDPRFNWNARVRVDLDVLDTSKWRLAFRADYDAMIGGERRPFDLNQGTYILDGTASRRLGASEIFLVTRHVSRHLTDRENQPSISWNFVGGRAAHTRSFGRSTLSGEIELGRAMQQAFVDYLWASELRLYARHVQSTRVEWLAEAEGGVIGTMRRVAGRPRLCGGRIEGGMRINGHAASVEVFIAYERRIDAFPTDRFRVRFTSIGFRLSSRP